MLIGWDSIDDIWKDFEIEPQKIDILLAVNEEDGYSGDAFVLFKQNGELYEVNASHCSCHGLEGEWRTQLTSAKALRYRMENGLFALTFREELAAALNKEDACIS